MCRTAWPQRNWNDISAGTPSKAAGLNRPDVNAAAQSAPARWSMIGRICDASKKALYQAPSGNKKPPDWLKTFEYAVQLRQEQRGQVVLSVVDSAPLPIAMNEIQACLHRHGLSAFRPTEVA